MDPHKVDSIQQWKVPTNKDLLQGFLESVGYLAPNIPQLHISTGILSKIAGETAFFRWTFTEQQVFDQIVKLVLDFRHNHRIVLDYSKNAPPINIVTDTLASGIGGIVSQGHDWKDSKIAAFFSVKLNPAQQNYPVHNVELLAGVETMLRHKNLLQGMHFFWYTNHRALEHILRQPVLSGRQAR
ncbi:DNA/RNA polymerase [Fomitiporia mediterranea MF3/22]|uniref:DNA/RNA polymerase n=1 Tax=Fomitiporia mediterranea (strain MF3/22) TaxID=694068 RepID=R7SF31_FOMME|nr:DNA/RNA polymerase [Fomitiporia mediterranea MF3/22]EJC97308.1 DNA/RNA polymerase [Fomitiporia mediterranea MF3/22]